MKDSMGRTHAYGIVARLERSDSRDTTGSALARTSRNTGSDMYTHTHTHTHTHTRNHTHARIHTRAHIPNQAGVVLPVTMLLMIILAVLALGGSRDTLMQERMTGNLRDRDTAFQAAEAALRDGEAWLEANPLTALDNTEMTMAEAQVWDGVSPAPTGSRPTLYHESLNLELASDPVYHVGPPQLLRVNPGETPARFQQIFPVTSLANGATETSVVVIRSTYKPL